MKKSLDNKLFAYYYLYFIRKVFTRNIFYSRVYYFDKIKLYVSDTYLDVIKSNINQKYIIKVEKTKNFQKLKELLSDFSYTSKFLCELEQLFDINNGGKPKKSFKIIYEKLIGYIKDNENILILNHQLQLHEKMKQNDTSKFTIKLCNKIISLDPQNTIFLLYYARFLARTMYGKTKQKSFLYSAEKIIYKVINIYKKENINYSYIPYSWLAMIYGYLSEKEKSFLFFGYGEKLIKNYTERRQFLEWKCGVLKKFGNFKEIIFILSKFYKLPLRQCGYLVYAYYDIGNVEKFKKSLENYIKQYFLEEKRILKIRKRNILYVYSTSCVSQKMKKDIKAGILYINDILIYENQELTLIMKKIAVFYKKKQNAEDIQFFDFEGLEKYFYYYMNL